VSVCQFANSIEIIRRSEQVNRPAALARHLYWQFRKLLFPRPITLPLSRSVITDDEPGGVISMVNMLGLYDYNNMTLVKLVLSGEHVMIDVGANIGSYTLIASEAPSARIISLEPHPATFAKLVGNINLNKRSNVEAMNVGASSRPGTLFMTDHRSNVLNRIVETPSSESKTVPVKVTTLDTLCQELDIRPSILKMDVEGHEPDVLAGSAVCLDCVDVCIVENGERSSIVEIMGQHGLKGPYYYHHLKSALNETPQRLPEDSVYISASFLKRFPHIKVG
jgi:FkbM family methyltransferase